MIASYNLSDTTLLAERYAISAPLPDMTASYIATIGTMLPVIRQVAGEPVSELMRWGIPRLIGPGKIKDTYDIRADKAFWSWKKLAMSQRVLIPVSSFAEWQAYAGSKQLCSITMHEESVFSTAGIWKAWQDEAGHNINTFSYISTEPNEDMLEVASRMPLILRRKDETRWIAQKNNNNQELLEGLLKPYDDGALMVREVTD